MPSGEREGLRPRWSETEEGRWSRILWDLERGLESSSGCEDGSTCIDSDVMAGPSGESGGGIRRERRPGEYNAVRWDLMDRQIPVGRRISNFIGSARARPFCCVLSLAPVGTFGGG